LANTLFVVATPIGNLQDITLRAISTLESVDYILCEDTRETAKLLHKYEIDKKMISYRDQNHERIIEKIVSLLLICDLAIVSDSGTPNISDPGFKLIRELTKRGVKIIPIPGPSAIISALSISALPTDKFIYLGFLPKQESARARLLEEYGKLETTLVIYESPFRIHKLLQEIFETLGDRVITVVKDMTKLKESIITNRTSEMLNIYKIDNSKGEFVVLISKASYEL